MFLTRELLFITVYFNVLLNVSVYIFISYISTPPVLFLIVSSVVIQFLSISHYE